MAAHSVLSKACTAALAAGIVVTAASPAGIPALLSALGLAGYDLAKNLVAGYLQKRDENRPASPAELLHNGHLLRLVAGSLSTCLGQLRDLAKKDADGLRYADHGKWSALAEKIGPYWQENFPSFDGTSFDELGKDRIARALDGYMRDSGKPTAASADEWRELLDKLAAGITPKVDGYILQRAAEHIHTRLPAVLYERTKESAILDPATFAGITLRFQSAILAEITQLPEKITQPILTEIRALAKAQADLIAEIREKEGAFFQSPAFTQLVTDFSALIPRLAERDKEHADQYTAISGKLDAIAQDARTAAANTQALLKEVAALREQVTAAHALLSQLSRQPITFAKPTVLPVAASKLFGRDADLIALREIFLARKQIAITGTGGLGKTALCSEFLRILSTDPATQQLVANGIFLHDFYKQPTLQGFIAGILGQAAVDVRDDTERLALVIRILQQPGIVLYIEGGEKIGQLSVLEPFLSPGTHVLFTTRIPKQPDAIDTFQLQPLKIDAAARAIHHYADALSRQKKRSPFPFPIADPGWPLLARDLGGLQLACRIAGHYCAARTVAPTALHTLLEREGLQRIISGDDSRANLHILFTQSARVLTPAALHAWSALTFGGARHTPVAILRAIGIVDDAALEMLCDHGIATADFAMSPETGEIESAYALAHALLAEWGRRELDKIEGNPAAPRPTHAEVVVEAAQWALDYWKKFLKHPEVHCRPEQYRHTAPVAEGILREVEPLTELPASDAQVFYYLPARMHHHHGQFALAEPIFRRCVERMKADAGEISAEYATALTNESYFYNAINRLVDAERTIREAIEITKKTEDENAPVLAIRLNNLAQLLQTTNRLEEAEPLMRRALEIFKASYGEGHPNVAVQLNNLAQLLQATNRLGEAEPMMRRALEIDEASFGPLHPLVGIRLNNLARLLQDTNRMGEAEPLMRRVVEIFLQFTAQTEHEHPHLRTAVRNFAVLLDKMGRPREEIGREIAALYGQYGVEFKGV